MNDSGNPIIFPKGSELSEALRPYFTGEGYLSSLIPGGTEYNCSISNVTFEPGCRNNWHKHPGGQILLVTHGRGWYQEKGRPAQELHAGDVVKIPSGVKHWHGAANDSRLIHLAVSTNLNLGPVEWLEPVTDQEYEKLK